MSNRTPRPYKSEYGFILSESDEEASTLVTLELKYSGELDRLNMSIGDVSAVAEIIAGTLDHGDGGSSEEVLLDGKQIMSIGGTNGWLELQGVYEFAPARAKALLQQLRTECERQQARLDRLSSCPV